MLSHITINEHSSIRIDGEKIIYIDPFRIPKEKHDADIIFVTHAHYDHFSPEDILKINHPHTLYVMPYSMQGEESKIGV
ncbi:MAG: MBL fold metallo-hydrolase, partial [Clostridia bacterium]|nr:MBL fold metallo-hydrolase [Clostridia bacterium]